MDSLFDSTITVIPDPVPFPKILLAITPEIPHLQAEKEITLYDKVLTQELIYKIKELK